MCFSGCRFYLVDQPCNTVFVRDEIQVQIGQPCEAHYQDLQIAYRWELMGKLDGSPLRRRAPDGTVQNVSQ